MNHHTTRGHVDFELIRRSLELRPSQNVDSFEDSRIFLAPLKPTWLVSILISITAIDIASFLEDWIDHFQYTFYFKHTTPNFMKSLYFLTFEPVAAVELPLSFHRKQHIDSRSLPQITARRASAREDTSASTSKDTLVRKTLPPGRSPIMRARHGISSQSILG